VRRLLHGRPLVVAGIGVVVFVAACLFIRGGLLSHERFGDVALYATDAHRMLDGRLPYRDFFFEYPPGALPVFVAPALVSTAHYTALFKILMVVLGGAMLCIAARIAASAELGSRRSMVAIGSIAISPLLVGPLLLDEYDIWPTLLTCLALLAMLRGRDRVGAGLLGFGAATKVFPAAILPAALLWVYRRSGRRAALRCLAVAVAAVFVSYVVFAALGPGGVWASIDVHLRRGLQKESLGSAVLYALDQAGLYKAHIDETNPSWTELTGTAGDALATVSSLCQIAACVAVAWVSARKRPDAGTLLYSAAAAVAGFVAFGKVFSPQYLIWLVPLVVLAGGLAASLMLAASLVLTQLWFLGVVTPFDLDRGIWLVVLRDLLVVGVFVSLLRRLARHAPEDPLREPRRASREADSGRARPT
jgi:uncharacterized membrane protein